MTSNYEYNRKNPIFNTDLDRHLSVIVEEMRDDLLRIRNKLSDCQNAFPMADRLKCFEGLLTCGLVTLHSLKKDIVEAEITWADQKRGKSLPFYSRDIGSDECPGCFVCGEGAGLMANVSAFVKSREDGEEIMRWFKDLARLDYRPSEPSRIQVKVGACNAHLGALDLLCEMTRDHCVLREMDIQDIKKEVANA